MNGNFQMFPSPMEDPMAARKKKTGFFQRSLVLFLAFDFGYILIIFRIFKFIYDFKV
jgi:hypothetical protein